MESFKMKFYKKCLEQAKTRPNGSETILYDDGSTVELLTVYPGTNHNPAYSGFYGHLFRFKTPDGRVVESNNCWHRGNFEDIPKSLQNKFEIWTKA